MEENYKDEMIVIDNVNRYNEIFGLETKHPLVSIIDLTKATHGLHAHGFAMKCMRYS